MVSTLTGSLVVSCAGDPSSTTGGGNNSNAPSSQAMGQWTPTTEDTCTKALHDTYFVLGPDGKKYPTWHPSQVTNPSTNTLCTFGHEHGPDPSQSSMWPAIRDHFAYDANSNGTIDDSERSASGIPFGYVSEQLVGSTTPRLEDHTAYKVAYGNGIERTVVDAAGTTLTSVTCDLFGAYNQPTSTADGFASTLYSVTYGVDCTGTSQYPVRAIVSVMAVYGQASSFTLDANNTQQAVNQAPVPGTSPEDATVLGRRVPNEDGLFPSVFVVSGGTTAYGPLMERWDANARLRRADATVLAAFAPQFRVDDPARYYATGAGTLARTIDLCYSGLNAANVLVTDPAAAATIVRKVRNDTKCSVIAPDGPATGTGQRVAFDDATSPFRGCTRQASFGAETVSNTGGPTTWYTDAFGERATTTRFASSVKQLVASGSNNAVVLGRTAFGAQTSCDATVHVPN